MSIDPSSAAITHDHPEGIKVAQAVAQALYGLPDGLHAEVHRRLPADLADVLDRFSARFSLD